MVARNDWRIKALDVAIADVRELAESFRVKDPDRHRALMRDVERLTKARETWRHKA